MSCHSLAGSFDGAYEPTHRTLGSSRVVRSKLLLAPVLPCPAPRRTCRRRTFGGNLLLRTPLECACWRTCSCSRLNHRSGFEAVWIILEGALNRFNRAFAP